MCKKEFDLLSFKIELADLLIKFDVRIEIKNNEFYVNDKQLGSVFLINTTFITPETLIKKK